MKSMIVDAMLTADSGSIPEAGKLELLLNLTLNISGLVD